MSASFNQLIAGGFVAGVEGEGRHLIHNFGVQADQVEIAKRKHRIQVHGRPQLGHAGHNYPFCCILFEQLNGQLGNGLVGGALAHADQHRTVTDGHDVPPFQGGRAVVDGGIAPPDVKLGIHKIGVEFVDGGGEDSFLVTGRPEEGIQGDSTIDSSRWCRGCRGCWAGAAADSR